MLEDIHEIRVPKKHIAEHFLKIFIAVAVYTAIIVFQQATNYLNEILHDLGVLLIEGNALLLSHCP